MFWYSMMVHCDATIDELEAWLVQRFGEPNERGWMEHGALGASAVRLGVGNTEDYDDQLDGPAIGEVQWTVENRGDPDACDEAMRTLFVAVPQLTIEFDASVLFLWERDVVYMARVGGEMIIYDRCHEWFRPDVEPFLPPHTVSSEYRLA